MTIHTTLDRRTALKTVGSSMLVGSFGSVRGFDSDEFGRTNLVEAGIRYQFEEDAPYDRYHVDGLADYWIDTNNDRLLLRKHVSADTKGLFKTASTIINSGDLTSRQAQVSRSGSVERLTTSFSSRMRVDKFISLAEPFSEPTVAVDYNGPEAKLQIDGNEHSVQAGEEDIIPLQSRTVTAKTRFSTGEKGTVPGMPDWRIGYKLETGTTTVTVTPEVVVTNFGELNVVETVR